MSVKTIAQLLKNVRFINCFVMMEQNSCQFGE